MLNKTSDAFAVHSKLKRTRKLVDNSGHMTVSLAPSQGTFISRKRRKQICQNILDLLSPACELALVYNLNEESKQVHPIQSHFTKRSGRHEIDLSGKSWWDFDKLLYSNPLFSSVSEARGTISLLCSHAKVPWENIFRMCYNPMVVNNVSVITNKTPLQYAQRKCDTEQSFILIGNGNNGLSSLTVVADSSNILSLFDLAANSCLLTRSYAALFPKRTSPRIQTKHHTNIEVAA